MKRGNHIARDIFDWVATMFSAGAAVTLFEYAQEMHSFILAGAGSVFLIIALSLLVLAFRRP